MTERCTLGCDLYWAIHYAIDQRDVLGRSTPGLRGRWWHYSPGFGHPTSDGDGGALRLQMVLNPTTIEQPLEGSEAEDEVLDDESSSNSSLPSAIEPAGPSSRATSPQQRSNIQEL